MTWHWGSKDGGPDSNSWVWGLELKNWFSILVVKFDGPSERTVMHNHAFNSLSFLLKGELHEVRCTPGPLNHYTHHFHRCFAKPIWTSRNTLHEVHDIAANTYVLSFRGKWQDTWEEYNPYTNEFVTLTHGRKKIE
jgi:hypothetical protein